MIEEREAYTRIEVDGTYLIFGSPWPEIFCPRFIGYIPFVSESFCNKEKLWLPCSCYNRRPSILFFVTRWYERYIT